MCCLRGLFWGEFFCYLLYIGVSKLKNFVSIKHIKRFNSKTHLKRFIFSSPLFKQIKDIVCYSFRVFYTLITKAKGLNSINSSNNYYGLNKMKIQTYTKQNRIQKEAERIYRIFKPLPCGLETYLPKSVKIKLGIIGGVGCISLITPFTNWIPILLYRGLLK